MLVHWRLSAYYFFYFAFIGGFSTYFGLYLLSLGMSAWHIGVLMSLMQVMRLAAPNLWGWLADRWGRRARVVHLSAAASLVAFLLFFAVDSFAGLFVAMALLGFFWSASLPLIEAITLGHLQKQPERYGRVRLWGSIGFIAAVTGMGMMLDRLPVQSMLWVSAALLFGMLIVALLVSEAPNPDDHVAATPLGDTLRRPEVRGLLFACFFMAMAHAPYYVFYSIYLVAHGYSKTLVGGFWAIGVLAEILVFLAMPGLMRKVSLSTILLTSFAAAVVRFLVIGWAVDATALLLFAQVLHGITFGAFHAASVAALNRWFARQHQAQVQALYGSVSFGAGGMLGGLLAGQAWDTLGPGMTFSAAAVCALCGGWFIWRNLSTDRVAMQSS
jgi:PPP family 3-phenylpropionic acid transporter